MKKLFAFLFALSFVLSAAATELTVNERVLQTFRQTFSLATNIQWEEHEEFYSVSFINMGVRSKVRYDLDGNMLSAIRYYDPSMLPLNIISTLKRSYPGRTLFGVTEITVGTNTSYYVKMYDSRFWFTLQFDSSGNSRLHEKYRKI